MRGFAGLGESSLAVPVRRRCRRFVVGVCKPGCFEGVEGSWSVWGCCRRNGGIVVVRIGYKVEVGLVNGMVDSAGHSWRLVGFAVKEDMVGSAGCRSGWKLGSWGRYSKEDRERTDSVVGRKSSARPECAVHMAVRLSCIGRLDYFAEHHCSLEYYRCSNVRALLALFAYAAH